MQDGLCRDIATVSYWEQNARWHKLWVSHTDYHRRIIPFLMERVQPHWRVLDIGAGDGVLSLPLCALGCDVTAIEPSAEMRKLLYARASSHGTANMQVEESAWETYSDGMEYDLAIACNSLHLSGGLASFEKLCCMAPKNILLVHEGFFLNSDLQTAAHGHMQTAQKNFIINSPYVYHSYSEAYEHLAFRMGCVPGRDEILQFIKQINRRDGHYWFDEEVSVSASWWTRHALS